MLNRIDGRTPALTKAAVEEIRKRGSNPIIINHRVEFIRADAAGKAANETDEKARAEIENLWKACKT